MNKKNPKIKFDNKVQVEFNFVLTYFYLYNLAKLIGLYRVNIRYNIME